MADKIYRVGMLGLDTSHAPGFTQRLNDPKNPEYVPGAKVVAGWPGGSKDFELSWSRVDKFTAELRDKFGVVIMDTPEAVAEAVDLVFIEACDGRVHKDLFARVAKFKRPTYIDKPLATSSADAKEIFRLADESGVPVMSCSTLRYADSLTRALAEDHGPVIGCDVFGPMELQPTQPGLYWYGIHGIEVMNVIMGRGCKEVRDVSDPGADLVTATWADGRIATYRGLRGAHHNFGVTIQRQKGFQFVDLSKNERSWYTRMLEALLAHLPQGKSPVDPGDTLEIIRLIEAANDSRHHAGRAVQL